ncbi:MAG: DNA-binding response regulator [Flavobacteriales bacterium]|nr:MAG: DNA-binding response regulator [Flavobacteriales bacterium]PIE49726.1 MAG: DNA-binding response regulator [Flavobacteriales bacterium]
MTDYTVGIVDDHLLFARSLKGLINSFDNFNVTLEANNGKVILNILKREHKLPDILLMDVNMPVMNGIETMAEISKHYPDLKVLALSMEDDEESILKMIKNGAKGYLLKDIHPQTLLEALNSVIEEGYYHTKRVSDILVQSLHKKEKKKDKINLQPREKEFLQHACTEMTYKEIADVMCLSPKTIDGYREQCFKKLNVKNRIGLVLYAMHHNLID